MARRVGAWLTPAEQAAVRLDFEEWTGGYGAPEASEAELEMYVDGACAVTTVNDDGLLRRFLDRWARNG